MRRTFPLGKLCSSKFAVWALADPPTLDAPQSRVLLPSSPGHTLSPPGGGLGHVQPAPCISGAVHTEHTGTAAGACAGVVHVLYKGDASLQRDVLLGPPAQRIVLCCVTVFSCLWTPVVVDAVVDAIVQRGLAAPCAFVWFVAPSGGYHHWGCGWAWAWTLADHNPTDLGDTSVQRGVRP